MDSIDSISLIPANVQVILWISPAVFSSKLELFECLNIMLDGALEKFVIQFENEKLSAQNNKDQKKYKND